MSSDTPGWKTLHIIRILTSGLQSIECHFLSLCDQSASAHSPQIRSNSLQGRLPPSALFSDWSLGFPISGRLLRTLAGWHDGSVLKVVLCPWIYLWKWVIKQTNNTVLKCVRFTKTHLHSRSGLSKIIKSNKRTLLSEQVETNKGKIETTDPWEHTHTWHNNTLIELAPVTYSTVLRVSSKLPPVLLLWKLRCSFFCQDVSDELSCKSDKS